MTALDFRSLSLWRELAEHVQRWRAAQPRSRRRQSFHASDVPEHLRHLLATRTQKRETWRAYDEKSESWVDGAYTTGDPMGLTAEQIREAVAARREYQMVRRGHYAGMGWVLRGDWEARLRWLADPESEAVLKALAGT